MFKSNFFTNELISEYFAFAFWFFIKFLSFLCFSSDESRSMCAKKLVSASCLLTFLNDYWVPKLFVLSQSNVQLVSIFKTSARIKYVWDAFGWFVQTFPRNKSYFSRFNFDFLHWKTDLLNLGFWKEKFVLI